MCDGLRFSRVWWEPEVASPRGLFCPDHRSTIALRDITGFRVNYGCRGSSGVIKKKGL